MLGNRNVTGKMYGQPWFGRYFESITVPLEVLSMEWQWVFIDLP
jgi:hypothetical protein